MVLLSLTPRAILSEGWCSVRPSTKQSLPITSAQVFLGRPWPPPGLCTWTFFSQPFILYSSASHLFSHIYLTNKRILNKHKPDHIVCLYTYCYEWCRKYMVWEVFDSFIFVVFPLCKLYTTASFLMIYFIVVIINFTNMLIPWLSHLNYRNRRLNWRGSTSYLKLPCFKLNNHLHHELVE